VNLDAMTVGELIQHALVTIVAFGALAVVLRKVLGVFDKRQASTPAPGRPSPTCSHCPTAVEGKNGTAAPTEAGHPIAGRGASPRRP
jgi:hypothetical protein